MPMLPPLPRNENISTNGYVNGVQPQTNGVQPQTNGVQPQTNGVQMEPNCQNVMDELQLYKNYFAENGLAPLAMPRMGGKYSYRSKLRKSKKSRRKRRR